MTSATFPVHDPAHWDVLPNPSMEWLTIWLGAPDVKPEQTLVFPVKKAR